MFTEKAPAVRVTALIYSGVSLLHPAGTPAVLEIMQRAQLAAQHNPM